MFDQLVLKNFRQHKALTVDFTHGLVAIRGHNEAGKTTVQEAIAYALFGAKALRETFSEVVTWGEAESTLAVQLTFTLEGVEHQLTRKKSGAELRFSDQLVTGQTEVTKHMEALLGATADIAGKLMLASQGALRGALEQGPAAAAALIQDLADFDLLDRIIALIQTELPNGKTTALVERISTLNQQTTADAPVLDTTEQERMAFETNEFLSVSYETQTELNESLKSLGPEAARTTITAAAETERNRARLTAEMQEAAAGAQAVPSYVGAGQAEIEAWRAALAGLAAARTARAAFDFVSKLADPEVVWEGSQESFEVEVARLTADEADNRRQGYQFKSEHQAAIARLITEQACAFCGKDLSSVPEVVQHNVLRNAEAVELAGKMSASFGTADRLAAELKDMVALRKGADAYLQKLRPYLSYVDLLDTHYPPQLAWKGDEPAAAGDEPDYAAQIREAEAALKAHTVATANQAAAAARLAKLQVQLSALPNAAELGKQVLQAKTALAECDALTARIATLTADIQRGQLQAQSIAGEIDSLTRLHAQRLQAWQQGRDQLAEAQAELESMNINNALIAKIRTAKPQISDRLWSIVLASVSSYFSQIRGTQSVVTRADNGFKVDGKSIGGLSGSTLDALGLAIRIALTRTFLPGAPFLMLDEAAAACDDERETNMLGLLATADFDQVLLVTHSTLADTFASQVVQL